jgi:hypothetical protein
MIHWTVSTHRSLARREASQKGCPQAVLWTVPKAKSASFDVTSVESVVGQVLLTLCGS